MNSWQWFTTDFFSYTVYTLNKLNFYSMFTLQSNSSKVCGNIVEAVFQTVLKKKTFE